MMKSFTNLCLLLTTVFILLLLTFPITDILAVHYPVVPVYVPLTPN